jgi:hypothetical protein
MAMVARMMPMKLTIFLLYTVLLLCPEDVVLVEHGNDVTVGGKNEVLTDPRSDFTTCEVLLEGVEHETSNYFGHIVR